MKGIPCHGRFSHSLPLSLLMFFSCMFFTEVLDFYANQLEGTIPKELAKIPNLSTYYTFWMHTVSV